MDPRRWPRIEASRVALGGMLLLYAMLKTYGVRPAVGDENIYFYMAARAAKGALPYRDFFFAHPPMHLLPGVLVAWLTEGAWWALKVIPMVASGVSGWLIFRIAHEASGTAAALAATALFLFSHDLLRASSHWTGANLATLWLCAGWWASERRRDHLAGTLYALAAGSAAYAGPVAVGLTLGRWLQSRRGGVRTVLAGVATFGVVNVLGLMLGGERYLDQVFAYHMEKPPTEEAWTRSVTSIALRNPWLLWSASLGIALLSWRWRHPAASRSDVEDERPWTLLRATLGLLAAAVMLRSLGRLYHFYFLVGFPAAAVLGGNVLGETLRAAGRWRPGTHPRPPRRHALLLLGAVLLLIGGAEATRRWGLSHKPWFQRDAGHVKSYVWAPSPLLPAPLDGLVEALFWKDRRRIGAHHLGITQYLWHESRRFEAAGPLIAAVTELAPPGPLFGDSTSTPLVALRTGRRLALDEADTNFMRFRTGRPTMQRFLARIERTDPPAAVVLRPGRGVATFPALRTWLHERYRLARRVRDPHHGLYLLLVRQ